MKLVQKQKIKKGKYLRINDTTGKIIKQSVCINSRDYAHVQIHALILCSYCINGCKSSWLQETVHIIPPVLFTFIHFSFQSVTCTVEKLHAYTKLKALYKYNILHSYQ